MDDFENNSDLFDEEQPDETPLEIAPEKRKIHFSTPTRKIKDLYDDYKQGNLDVRPSFQRGYVWDFKKACRLVESIFLKVPIPVIYTAELQDGTEIVIDGQQRLLSLFGFIDGIFPKDNKEYKLRGLEVLEEFEGKIYRELETPVQNTFKNYAIPLIIISKDSDEEVKFDIFERLNMGSVKLNDQELRNCVYRGKYNELLGKLSDNQDFQYILNSPKLRERMLDDEFVLRFFALYRRTFLRYKPPMKQVLNQEMKDYQNIDSREAMILENLFKKTVDVVKTIFGETAFRRFVAGTEKNHNGYWEPRKINKGLFDIIMWGFSQYDKNQIIPNADAIREELIYLMTHDERFVESLRVSTDSLENTQLRFDKWREALKNIIGYPRTEPRNFSWNLKKQLYDSDPTCKSCNQRILALDDAEVDHIDFYWRGGKTIPSNARLVHRFCNRHRGGREES